ncbi:MAG: hypothetical protein RJB62_227 [Pseudomonadota bacterium]|jgi:hypothetical protein
MRRTGWIAVFIGLVFSSPAFAQGWMEYTNMQDHFFINFPGEPTIEEDYPYNAEGGQRPADAEGEAHSRRYQAFDGDSRYAVIVVNYREINHTTTLKGAVAWAAGQYRRMGEVTFDNYAHLDRLDGHQLQIILPGERRMYVSIYMHYPDRKLYILEAEAPLSAPPPQHFTAALQVLDEEGQSIRYVIDDFGNATRETDR